MLIDWFTVGAQALNFVVLVWLMKRFLYRPIRHAIDEREKRIAAEIADADSKKAEAKKEREEFAQKNKKFGEERATLLSQVTEEAKTKRRELMSQAQEEAEFLKEKHKATLRSEARDLSRALEERTRDEVFAIARRTLTDLASASLEERISDVFIRRLHALEVDAKANLREALLAETEPVLVQSAFELPEQHRAAIQNAVNETFSADIHLRFATAPDLVSGIELSTNGLKVGWSIAAYLASMEVRVTELLEDQAQPRDTNDRSPSKANLEHQLQ